MKKNKGFTLIELLVTIAILAVIVLIAVPLILNIINKARIQANKNSLNSLIKAVKYYYMFDAMDKGYESDLLFTFGDYEKNEDEVEEIENVYGNNVEYETINTPLSEIENIIRTDNKSIGDLVDYSYYDASFYDNEQEYTKIMVESIEEDIQQMLDDQLFEYDYLEEDDTENYLLDLKIQNNIQDIHSTQEYYEIENIIKNELLVSGREPDYGYVKIVKGKEAQLEARIIYGNLCYTKDADTNKITTSDDLRDCGMTRLEKSYTAVPQVSFTLLRSDIDNINNWYNKKLKIIMEATHPEGDSIDFIKYCHTSEEYCDPIDGGQTTNDDYVLIDLNSNGSITYCAYAVTKSGLMSEIECSDQYNIDTYPPQLGKIKILGEHILDGSDYYNGEVIIEKIEDEKIEDGVDNESAVLEEILSMNSLNISSFGTLVSLLTIDEATNYSIALGKVKIDNELPNIYGIDNSVIIKEGTQADFNKGVMVVDAISGGLGYTLSSDEIDVNNTKSLGIGSYEVIYTAYDKSGNSKEYTRTLDVMSTDDYINEIQPIDPVCIGEDCACSGGDCFCEGNDCDDETGQHKTYSTDDSFTITIEPNSQKKKLQQQNNTINTGFWLKVHVERPSENPNIDPRVKAIYWCVSTSDGMNAEACNPLEHYDGSYQNSYKNIKSRYSKVINKSLGVNLTTSVKNTSVQKNKSGSTKLCVYATGWDDTKSKVYCSDLYIVDKQKPTPPTISVNGQHVTYTTTKKVNKVDTIVEEKYYKSGATAVLSSTGTDNFTPSNELKYEVTPKNLKDSILSSTGAQMTRSMTIKVKVIDKAGNYDEVKQSVKIDNTAPSYVLSKKAYKLYSGELITNGKSDQPIKLELYASQSKGAKVEYFEVSTDKINWETISPPYIIHESGRYYFRPVDEFGQKSKLYSSYYAKITNVSSGTTSRPNDSSLSIPKIDPTPKGYAKDKVAYITYGGTGEYDKLLRVSGSLRTTASVDLIKCTQEKYSGRYGSPVCDGTDILNKGQPLVDGIWYQTTVSSIALNVYDNNTTIIAQARNSDGLVKSVSQNVEQIDGPPTTPVIMGGGDFWQKEANVSLKTSSSSPSGIDSYEYCANTNDSISGCNWIKLSSTNINYKESGEHYIFFRSKNNVGLYSTESNSQFVKIDNTAPTAEIAANNKNVQIKLKDSQSGLKQYCVTTENDVSKCQSITLQDAVLNTNETNKWFNLPNVSEQTIIFNVNSLNSYYLFTKDKVDNVSQANEFTVSFSGIPSKGYSAGELVNYAGLQWKVITDNGDTVTLITNGYYQTGRYGDTKDWNSSTAKTVVNNDFINAYPTLKQEIDAGGIVYDSSSSSYVRLPRYEEVSTAIGMTSPNPFWTMTNYSENRMYVSLNTGSFYRTVYDITYWDRYYTHFDTVDPDDYIQREAELSIMEQVPTKCSTKQEITTANSISTQVKVGSSCEAIADTYYSTSVTNISARVKFTSSYCNRETGTKKADETDSSEPRWVYATGGNNCKLVTYYDEHATYDFITYRPVITAKKQESFKTIDILENKTYAQGETVDYANLKWQVISDKGNSVTMILNGNYKSGRYGSSSGWYSSTAKVVVNNDFVNDNILIKNAIANGYIIYDSSTYGYVRLPEKDEVNSNITSSSLTPFWTMTANGDNVYYSLYDGQLNTGSLYGLSNTVYYNGYVSELYEYRNQTQMTSSISTSVPTSCWSSSQKRENLASPIASTVIVSQKCGNYHSQYYYSSRASTTTQGENSNINITYCDKDDGKSIYKETAFGAQYYYVYGAYTSGSGTVCNIVREASLDTKYEPIGYRPVITVLKGEI